MLWLQLPSRSLFILSTIHNLFGWRYNYCWVCPYAAYTNCSIGGNTPILQHMPCTLNPPKKLLAITLTSGVHFGSTYFKITVGSTVTVLACGPPASSPTSPTPSGKFSYLWDGDIKTSIHDSVYMLQPDFKPLTGLQTRQQMGWPDLKPVRCIYKKSESGSISRRAWF